MRIDKRSEIRSSSHSRYRSQLEENYARDQITMKEYIDPFTGRKIK